MNLIFDLGGVVVRWDPDAIIAKASLDSRLKADLFSHPDWLEVDRGNFTGTLKGPPLREELNEPSIREQYVVEYYSR